MRLVQGIPASATATVARLSPSPSSSPPPPPSSSSSPPPRPTFGLLNGLGAIILGRPTSTPSPEPSGSSARSAYSTWDNRSAALQVFYPAGSVNPAGNPKGGAQFYATPLDLTSAQTVTMGYSVFFPANFNWVYGGKLPGLYGGHISCSGGNAALDCFSTRLMWRSGGEGELYLYAPKNKQTHAMCADPQSDCNAEYGFSIGRGSFDWAAGAWTHVEQTVRLNTPGKQDGGFRLLVNGQPAISRDDVFYRDKPPPSASTTNTFFGGHGSMYATPKDQYVWFKDFSLIFNA
ncbi:hypothetical protein GGX14DRAFT_353251 [Mycena pura]|uniref:Polysaccharide lyase 14 domain-containing protein n=1 Tax=Mycena pura TaxID=153505 RepID=A0AAD6VVY2_9AGAR|nr:hypothetical protein GGX14DRAFT_353251 [Mycena pura]